MDAKLYFKYGVMGAGKTYDLIKSYLSFEKENKKIVIMKPFCDTKGGDYILSRDGTSLKVDFLIKDTDNIYLLIYNYLIENNLDYIFVDEVQFLKEKQINQLADIVDNLNIPVICYGIRSDFQNNLFEGSKSLFELADERIELIKKCTCGKNAIYNIRFNKDDKPVFEGKQIAIDEEEYSYKSMCRKCLKKTKLT